MELHQMRCMAQKPRSRAAEQAGARADRGSRDGTQIVGQGSSVQAGLGRQQCRSGPHRSSSSSRNRLGWLSCLPPLPPPPW